MKKALFAATTAVMLGHFGPVWAASSLDDCVGATKADDKIKICTAVLEAGELSDTDRAEALAQRGFGHYTNNRYRYAFPDLDEAIALDPTNRLAWWTRAMSYKFMGQHDKSITDFDQALALRPDAQTYLHRGGGFFGGGLFDRAIEDYNRALELDPNYAEAYFFRAVVYRDMDEHDNATRDLKKAFELDPDNPVYRQAMKDRGYLE